jgi:hypothetical protein
MPQGLLRFLLREVLVMDEVAAVMIWGSSGGVSHFATSS